MAKEIFKKGEFVVYPSHGVGQIIDMISEKIAGLEMKFYLISLEKKKMKLSVPVDRALKIGLRGLTSETEVKKSLERINEAAQTSRGIMWSRRAQEYEKKINSGSMISVSEVIRDLHRNVKNPDRSYSERLIYDEAYDRFVSEACLIKKISREEFENEFNNILKIDEIIPEEYEEIIDKEFEEDEETMVA